MTTKTTKTTTCECGTVTGERCRSEPLPRSKMARVRWVRPDRRGTAQALGFAGVSGSTARLAETLRVHPECVEMLLLTYNDDGDQIPDPWVEVVAPAGWKP